MAEHSGVIKYILNKPFKSFELMAFFPHDEEENILDRFDTEKKIWTTHMRVWVNV